MSMSDSQYVTHGVAAKMGLAHRPPPESEPRVRSDFVLKPENFVQRVPIVSWTCPGIVRIFRELRTVVIVIDHRIFESDLEISS
jgi:hypothetical protein